MSPNCLFFKINLFIYVNFWLHWVFVVARAFSSYGEQGLLFVAVRGLPIGLSHCEARALGTQSSVVAACGLSSCGSQALEHRLSSCGTRA